MVRGSREGSDYLDLDRVHLAQTQTDLGLRSQGRPTLGDESHVRSYSKHCARWPRSTLTLALALTLTLLVYR